MTTATLRNGLEIVIHQPFVGGLGRKKVRVIHQVTEGGKLDGSRIYIGAVNEKEVFTVSVPDSDTGSDYFQEWVKKNKITIDFK